VAVGAVLECLKTGKGVGNLATRRRISGWQFRFLALARFVLHKKTMKTVVNKVKRSGVYYLMTSVTSADESRNAKSDTWGVVAVVVLLLAVVSLMRFFLTV
jgi:hypothetical protein